VSPGFAAVLYRRLRYRSRDSPSPTHLSLNLFRSAQTSLRSARFPIPRFPRQNPRFPRRGFRFSCAVGAPARRRERMARGRQVLRRCIIDIGTDSRERTPAHEPSIFHGPHAEPR
jgi:hypothetical protein